MSRLLRHLAGGLDPVILARNIGMECDPWQAKVLRDPHKRELLVVHRQGGKSTVAAVAAVHCALYKPNSLILVVAPSFRQSQMLFRSVVVLYRTLGRPVAPEAENELSLTLENGARVVALPGDNPDTIRGYAGADLVIVDEAARVEEETFVAVTPMVATSGGRLLVMSTPHGRQGWFFEMSRSRDWRVTTVTVDQCSRINAAYLEAARRELAPWKFAEEWMCEFTDTDDTMYDSDGFEAFREASKLAGPGALFSGPEPAPLEEIDAPIPHPELGDCPVGAFGHHHAWRADRCLACGLVSLGVVA